MIKTDLFIGILKLGNELDQYDDPVQRAQVEEELRKELAKVSWKCGCCDLIYKRMNFVPID